MHWQSANPFRERDHRIATMPLDRDDIRKGTIRGFMAMCLVFAALGFAWGMLP